MIKYEKDNNFNLNMIYQLIILNNYFFKYKKNMFYIIFLKIKYKYKFLIKKTKKTFYKQITIIKLNFICLNFYNIIFHFKINNKYKLLLKNL